MQFELNVTQLNFWIEIEIPKLIELILENKTIKNNDIDTQNPWASVPRRSEESK